MHDKLSNQYSDLGLYISIISIISLFISIYLQKLLGSIFVYLKWIWPTFEM